MTSSLRLLRSIALMSMPRVNPLAQVLVSVSRTIGQAQFLHSKNVRYNPDFVAVQQRRKQLQKRFAKPIPKRPKGK